MGVSCQRVTDLLPAWYYNFRVSMVTWGEPPLSCCDSSTVSFVTGLKILHFRFKKTHLVLFSLYICKFIIVYSYV